jgi:hypothetical protein
VWSGRVIIARIRGSKRKLTDAWQRLSGNPKTRILLCLIGFSWFLSTFFDHSPITEKKYGSSMAVVALSMVATVILLRLLFDEEHDDENLIYNIMLVSVAAGTAWVWPIGLVMLDQARGVTIFGEQCPTASLSDYSYFVLDNFAKGALIDVLQSFNIDLYRCAPVKSNLYVSLCNLFLRSYMTYIVVWAFLGIWVRRASKKARMRHREAAEQREYLQARVDQLLLELRRNRNSS